MAYIASQYTIPQSTTNLVTGAVSARGLGLSRTISLSDNPSTSRARPKPAELIWKGTAYSKSESSTHFESYVRRNVKTSKGYMYQYMDSSKVVLDANAVYPPAPRLSNSSFYNELRTDVMNVANALGEYKQTAGMFSSYARTVYNSYRMMRKGNYYGAMQYLGLAKGRELQWTTAPANAWLGWKYGVSPLMSDLYASYTELKKQCEKPLTRCVRKSKTAYLNETREISPERFKTIDAYYKIQKIMYVEIDSAGLAWASDHGLTNPLSLIWELTPYSFVVDWFIDIGSFLQSLDLPAIVKRSVVYTTVKQRSLVYGITRGQAGQGGDTLVLKQAKCFGRHRKTSRSVGALGIEPPQFAPAFGASRITSALSLLAQIKIK